MFLKITRDYMKWKAGDYDDVSDKLADFLVTTEKVAERANFDEYHAATRAHKDAELATTIMGQVTSALTEFQAKLEARGGTTAAKDPHPPGTGNGVNFTALAMDPNDPITRANQRMLDRHDRILGLQRSVDADTGQITLDRHPNRHVRREAAAGIAEVLDLVGCVGHPERHAREKVSWAERRLKQLSGEIREETFNESTGKWDTKFMKRGSDGSVTTVMRTGTDSVSGGTTYGFVLQPEYLGNIFEISMERQVFADATFQVPMAQGVEVKWPAWDQYTTPVVAGGMQQSASYAGLDLFYASENANRTLTDANLNMINFKAVDLTAFTALSRDFIVDNYVQYDAALTRMIGRAFGWMEDYMTIQGNGIGRPQGFLNAAGALTVTRKTTSEILVNDIQNMIASVHPMLLGPGQLRWLTNITCFQYLSILQQSSGAFAFQPNALLDQAMPFSAISDSVGGTGADLYHRPMGRLAGFPLYFTEKLPVLGSTGDLCLVAPSQYGLAKRSGLEIAVSEHYYFQTDLIAYRFKLRHDGKLLWRYPYQQADGSATKLSPIVLLHS